MTQGKIESEYPPSPLQHGMLFHALAAPGSGVDIEQMVCTLREEIDPEALRAAWRHVIARHPILRTAFHWEAQPVQQVWEKADAPWHGEDWRETAADARESRMAAWLRDDRRRGFAMDEAPLMRLALFHFGEREHCLVWTFHHALLDGRSFPIVLREVFAFYAAIRAGTTLALPSPRPYRDHIDWLQTQDPSASAAYWREALSGFTAPTPLVIDGLPGRAAESAQGDCEIRLSTASTAALRDLAAANDLTLNTLVQGAWSLLLARYSGEDDIVFGATRACRRSSVEGAGDMVGLFINTLPVRVRIAPGAALLPWLRDLRAQWVAMRAHEHTPLASVQAWSAVPGGRPLFESIVVFENHDLNSTLRATGGEWEQRDFRLYEQTNFALTLAAYAGSELLLRMEFDHARFAGETIGRLLGHLRVIIESFASNPGQSLRDVPLLTDAERRQLLVEWNPPAETTASDDTLHEIFARQAARTPDAIALICDDARLTYRELDERAERLAGHLRSLGVAPEVIVGLCMERSIDLVVGLLAIVKAGGAYLPIDLAYPAERIAFILEDAQAPILLTQSSLVASVPKSSAQVVCIDQLPPSPLPPSAFRLPSSALAYVIYTSGSTGKPKGCCITHRNVVRLFSSTDAWFRFGPADVWTMFHSVAFDFSVWEIWGALLYGGRLVIVPHRISRSPEQFHDLLLRERVTVLNQTPSAFRQLIAADEAVHQPSSLRLVIFGGEALEMQSLRPWFDRHGDERPQLVNMYGITETTVHVTYRPLRASDLQAGSVIGIPIPDLRIHILDSALRPVPIGVPGELFVGGAGVARGYLRRPELTAERFIASPFADGDRLYRTGDLARWLPGRDIEYLGRIDQQVKIRGFRIELGEIESLLSQHPAIREASVVARAEPGGEKRLVAYFVPRGETPSTHELRAHLKTRLPDYMLPAAFLALDRLPLTGNGKLDTRALPAPEPSRPDLASRFVAPRTPAESALADIWQRVLRLERVGVNDNFFELGGDSILSILIISQARKAGLLLTPKHLFDHQTIADLAAVVPAPAAAVAPDSETGDAPLTPIQRWFFDHDFADPHHWNQSFVFRCDEPLDLAALELAVEAVARRMEAAVLPAATRDDAKRAPAFFRSPALSEADIASASAEAQASLDLRHGPLLRVVHFAPGAARTARLLIVAHHLAIDGVSWPILIDDLETAYGQAAARSPIQLAAPATSPAHWARLLTSAAASPAVRADIAYWQSLAEKGGTQLPLDHATGENTEASARTIAISLDEGETTALLQRVPAMRQTRINDVLLAALAPAFAEWTGEPSLLLDLEGHGREEALLAEITGLPAADLSRTAGWFTSIFPVRLDLPRDGADPLAAVAAQLRAIPQRGLSYGLLRHLTDDATARALETHAPVLFNYLGQFDQMLAGSKLFALTHEPTGPWHSPRARRTHVIEINCLVVAGRLEARWTYSENLHRAETISRLASCFTAGLRGIVDSAAGGEKAAASVESYPLSPIQRLYHTLEAAQPNAGFDQWHCLLRGPLEVARFERAWRGVFARHPILRTAFADEAQHVAPDAAPALRLENWRDLSPAQQAERLAEFLRADRERGFDLSQPPLTRLALLRLRDDEWRFVWSHHHLQIDGWSWPLLFREVGALYSGATLAPAPPYCDYIEWQQRQPIAASEDFWRNNLRGFTDATPLPVRLPRSSDAGTEFHEETLRLSSAATTALRDLARRSHVTLNVLVQTAWALLLGRSAGRGDIVFGASFSGRPADLPGVENIAGPFVNNLPIRVGIEGAEPLSALLRRVQAGLFELNEHQSTPLTQIQEWSEMPWHSRLFESLLVFQNYLVDDAASRLGDGVTIHDLVAPVRTNYPLTIVAIPGPELALTAIAPASAFTPPALAQWLAQLTAVLEAMCAADAPTAAELQALIPAPAPAKPAAVRARSATFIAPRTPTEHAIAAVWREAFRTESVGIQENFFDLGGHSLLMIRVHARLRETLRSDISVVRMFQHPTIESLARHLDGGQPQKSASADIAARAERQKAALARQRLITRQQ